MSRRFEDASVLVTGSAGGFGAAAARRFASEGARLTLCDRDEAGLEAVAGELMEAGHAVEWMVGDVSLPRVHDGLIARAVETYGRLDIAVNNAGIVHPFKRLADLDEALVERVVAVNLMGTLHALRAQLPVMERQHAETGRGGVIVNVASAAGLVGAPLLSAYAAAKHGVVGLTKSVAAESARRGVRVNAICPSFADTAMVKESLSPMRGGREEALSRVVAAVPMRRLASVDEVVEAILFACAPENGFMTGHALAIDGGLSSV